MSAALVTGAGRDREIGTAVCRALAEAGHDIAFTVPPGGLNVAHDLEGELRAKGAQVAALEVDLADAAALPQLLDEATERLGRLPAILVNNAAHSVNAGFAAFDAATLDDHYAVNLRAPAVLSCELARRHTPGEPGRIVCMITGQSLGPMLGELPYTITKGGLETFVKQLSAEVMGLGITVNAVNPGVTDTGWIPAELRPELTERMPAGRIGQSEDAARLIAWLCSEDAAWITGQVIASEGGFLR
jgi:3-oxoacyl-[acyl-carrier protein] reductase